MGETASGIESEREFVVFLAGPGLASARETDCNRESTQTTRLADCKLVTYLNLPH